MKRSEDSQESVLSQIKEAYADGRITDVEELERQIELTLKDFVLMDGEGWPYYYDAQALESYVYL